MILSLTTIENSLNKHRQQHQLRVLWPDYEVQDLLQKGISIWELARFTSAPLNITKYDKLEEIVADAVICKNWTHVAVHRVTQLGLQLNKVERYYVVLSKRGLAVDQLKSKFQRGSYIISVHVAQLQKLVFLWGVEAISGERRVIGPRYISKRTGMWRIQFETEKPLKSILFYSTRREPKYGKSTYGSQLPKDAKLQFCMNFKGFSSFLESFMKKDQNILENVLSFIPSRSREIIFLPSDSGNKNQKETQPKVKNEQNSINRVRSLELLSKNKEINVKILPNSPLLEINRVEDHYLTRINPVQIMQFIQKTQKLIHESLQDKKISNLELKEMITNINFSEIQRFYWSDISKLLRQISKVQDLSHAIQYLLAGLIFILRENNSQKTMQNWLQLNQSLKLIKEEQSRQRFGKWIESLMFQYCQQILKDSDQQQIQMIENHKDLIIRSIKWQLQSSNHQSSKISDLLYLLMKIQGKKNIFDLYHSHQLTNQPIIITPSIKQWQNRQNFYPKDDSDMIYQTEASIQAIQYQQTANLQTQNKDNDQFDFTLSSFHEKFPNKAFLSGKKFTVNGHTFKYYIFIEKSILQCFVERIESLSQESSQTFFTSFYILIEMTVNSTKKSHKFGWSFISPSHSIGTIFTFEDFDENSRLQWKISFKREVIHESILNYLRVRYEQFLKMQNKCSDKLQQQNKKLLKRRSSLFLERSLPDDVNFGNSIEYQCFLHGTCQKCQIFTEPTSLYKLCPLDLYKLMLSASFKQEVNAFLVTTKYLILTPDELLNKQFWLSQIRVNHLNLKQLLTLVNTMRLDRDTLQLTNSLIQQKIKQYGPRQQKTPRKIKFIAKDQSRVGKSMWDPEEADYCGEYLSFLNSYSQIV